MDHPAGWISYRNALREVLESGESIPTPQGVDALTKMQVSLQYPLVDGFPVITERSLSKFWRKPIGELCAFINGATKIHEMVKFGCDWWTPYDSTDQPSTHGLEPGELGAGSYGGAFHEFPQPDGSTFDQFANLVTQIRLKPHRRTHFVSPWIPFYIFPDAGMGRKVIVAPCHGWIHVRIISNSMHLHLFQRAGDLAIGIPSNMVQYAALMLMLSHLTGYPAHTFYHTISDAHIYEDQIPFVKEMLSREVRRLPFLSLNDEGKEVDDIHDFRANHFDLIGYDPHPSIQIPFAL